jgi:hypothetical protein
MHSVLFSHACLHLHTPHDNGLFSLSVDRPCAGSGAEGLSRQDGRHRDSVPAQHGAVVRRRSGRRAGLLQMEAPLRHQPARRPILGNFHYFIHYLVTIRRRPVLHACICMLQGVMVTGVSYYLQTWCLEMRGPMFFATWTPLCFVFTIFCSSFFLGEIVHLGR